jgi:UDP-N-acetylmuramoylalanine--D-glutamate ligase
VEHLVLFGEAAEKIDRAVGAALREGRPVTLRSATHCIGLQQAVRKAALLAEAGDVVLLSPGCTSFDEFTDFEERGKCFIEWVNEIE